MTVAARRLSGRPQPARLPPEGAAGVGPTWGRSGGKTQRLIRADPWYCGRLLVTKLGTLATLHIITTMTNQNPYAPPQAELHPPIASGTGLQDAMAGRYQFGIAEVMLEAWQLTKGWKATAWAALAAPFCLLAVLAAFNNLLLVKILGASAPFLGPFLAMAYYPLALGIFMVGVRRAAGLSVSFSTPFNYFDRVGSALLAGLLSSILTFLGMLLLVIPGVYLVVAYYLAMPLLGDRELSAWQALETSRKATTKRWFSVFALAMLVVIVVSISALPLGLGLIWSVPWSTNVMGVLYKRMFGVASTT